MMPNIEQKVEEAIFVQGAGANDLDLRTPKSVNTADVENFVVDDVDESEGENNLGVEIFRGEQNSLLPSRRHHLPKQHHVGKNAEQEILTKIPSSVLQSLRLIVMKVKIFLALSVLISLILAFVPILVV
jgi:hypothetical protein